MRLNTGITVVDVGEEDLLRLKALKGKRVIFTPNHSEGNEPYVLFHLSKMLDTEFNYLTAREVFERYFPAGRLLQAVGCYSVIRGAPDRHAFRTTKELLLDGKHWVVAFPEGIAAGMGDLVMPFEEGIVQIAFSALDDLRTRGLRDDVYVLPLAVKPVFLEDVEDVIDRTLGRLETKLFGAALAQSEGFRKRLIRLGEAIFAANENVYGIRPVEGASLNERLQVLKGVILSRIGGAVGCAMRSGQTESDHIRDLFNAIDRIVHSAQGKTGYEERLLQEQRLATKPLYATLLRVFEFVAFDTRYLDENPTVERFLDVLGLLEHEVFGRRTFHGPRKALVKVGDPICLGDHMDRYRKDKRSTIGEVTVLLHSSVQAMVSSLSLRSHPMKPEPHEGRDRKATKLL
jgi:hypothetical protein